MPEGVVRNENRLGLVREYKTKGIPEDLSKKYPEEYSKKKNKKRRAILVVHING